MRSTEEIREDARKARIQTGFDELRTKLLARQKSGGQVDNQRHEGKKQ